MTSGDALAGVQFVEDGGQRSSQRVGRTVLAAAVGDVDPALAQAITSETKWRKNYVSHFRDAVAAGARASKSASTTTERGLGALAESLVYVDGSGERPLAAALGAAGDHKFETFTLQGEGEIVRELVVPYRGRALHGDELLRQLDVWERAAVVEPSGAEAIRSVIRNPEWLDTSGRTFVLLGAASEMGPLIPLASWGADIVAIDLPRPHLWEHIVREVARRGGRLRAPTTRPVSDARDLVDAAGADLLAQTPQVLSWLESLDQPFVVGNYVYADGATFVRLAGAVDALVDRLVGSGTATAVAYLATPTDVYAVPDEVVSRSRSSAQRTGPLRGLVKGATGGRTYTRNYRSLIDGENGRTWGISDALVPIQGPNYALAKHVQRWRALELRERGCLSSANVAPATRTKSVVKNRMLAAAYRGASRFGIEIFESETSRMLTAALLVHDLNNPAAAANPATRLDHPFDLFAQGALHGGMWTSAYEPRSVLPLALAAGMVRRKT